MLEKLDEIRENIFRYLEARIELFKLETRGKVEEGVVHATHAIVLALLATMTTIFLFALLAAFLNKVLDSRYLGFLIVAGFFLILTVVWALAKDFLYERIRKMAYGIIKKRQEHKKEEKEEIVRDLMAKTTESLKDSGQRIEQGPQNLHR